MSQEFLDPEIFSDFIIEAREHLLTIEPALLELEKNPGNTGLLNDIFRPMHSLKGASGFLGLTKINGLAHKAENILDELRNAKMVVTSEIMDVILSATDALTQMIDNLDHSQEEGQVATGPIIEHIEALLAGGSAAPAVLPAKAVAAPVAPPAPEPKKAPAKAADALPPFKAEPYALTVSVEGHLHDFLEEAWELLESVGAGLVAVEKEKDNATLVNDLFRYFHNLKGNCGIIGFAELGALCHEAETLLGRLRKGEIAMSAGFIDLLLAASDLMGECLAAVDAENGKVTPVDTRRMVAKLQQASAGQATDQPPAARQRDADDAVAFYQTATQQLDAIRVALDALAQDGGCKEMADALFRSLTTLANSCGYMDFKDVQELAKRTAGLVDQARKSDMDFSLMVDILRQECDILAEETQKRLAGLSPDAAACAQDPDGPACERLEAQQAAMEEQEAEAAPGLSQPEFQPEFRPEVQPEFQPEEPAMAAAPDQPARAESARAAPQDAAKADTKAKASSTIRVDHEKLDHLMNVIGELIINRNRFAMLARSLEEGRMEVAEVAQHLSETTDAMARISDDLQDTIMKVRMVPMTTVFSRFPRLVRDLSRKSGKEVELVTEGEETELDKSVVEEIGDPLVHLIRNCVDHGLEPAEERLAAGKKPVGKVWLRAYHKGNSVAIEVEDDGRGINPEKMRASAVKKGLMSAEEAQALDDRQAIELIFAPGFSTAEKITDISGRGVGMDVVRTNIKNLKGSVNVTSEVGKGTRFTLSLPLTLAIIDALMVTVGDDTFAIPLDAVSETTKIEARKLSDINQRKALTLRGEVLGIVELREIMEMSGASDDRELLSIVILQDNDRRLGLVVDKLLERQEIVIKPLGTYLSGFDLRGVSGATIMGDGSVVLILDPHEICQMATSSARAGYGQNDMAQELWQ